MITGDQIAQASTTLANGKIKPIDVSKLVSAIRLFFGGLEEQYNYQFKDKLEALDDSTNNYQDAAQCVAALRVMEEEGFDVSGFSGSGSGMFYKAEEEYLKYVLFVFSKLYPVPIEFAKFNRVLWQLNKKKESQTVLFDRIP